MRFNELTMIFISNTKTIMTSWQNGCIVRPFELDSYEDYLEGEDPDWSDDVDETFYDPYMGCDCWDDGCCDWQIAKPNTK